MVANLAGDRKETAQEMLENAGYGKGVAKTPSRVLESPGVQQELRKLGFNPEDAKEVVAEILNTGNKREKLLAAREIFKVTGQYAPVGLQVGAARPFGDISDKELDEKLRQLQKEQRAERMTPEKLAEVEELLAKIEEIDEEFGSFP